MEIIINGWVATISGVLALIIAIVSFIKSNLDSKKNYQQTVSSNERSEKAINIAEEAKNIAENHLETSEKTLAYTKDSVDIKWDYYWSNIGDDAGLIIENKSLETKACDVILDLWIDGEEVFSNEKLKNLNPGEQFSIIVPNLKEIYEAREQSRKDRQRQINQGINFGLMNFDNFSYTIELRWKSPLGKEGFWESDTNGLSDIYLQ